jgi:hypothetical protein
MFLGTPATLDGHFKKRLSVFADDEELKNSFISYIVEAKIVAFLEAPIKGRPRRAGWLVYCLRFRI